MKSKGLTLKNNNTKTRITWPLCVWMVKLWWDLSYKGEKIHSVLNAAHKPYLAFLFCLHRPLKRSWLGWGGVACTPLCKDPGQGSGQQQPPWAKAGVCTGQCIQVTEWKARSPGKQPVHPAIALSLAELKWPVGWEWTAWCFTLAGFLLTSISYRNCEELNAYLQLQNIYVPWTVWL